MLSSDPFLSVRIEVLTLSLLKLNVMRASDRCYSFAFAAPELLKNVCRVGEFASMLSFPFPFLKCDGPLIEMGEASCGALLSVELFKVLARSSSF